MRRNCPPGELKQHRSACAVVFPHESGVHGLIPVRMLHVDRPGSSSDGSSKKSRGSKVGLGTVVPRARLARTAGIQRADGMLLDYGWLGATRAGADDCDLQLRRINPAHFYGSAVGARSPVAVMPPAPGWEQGKEVCGTETGPRDIPCACFPTGGR